MGALGADPRVDKSYAPLRFSVRGRERAWRCERGMHWAEWVGRSGRGVQQHHPFAYEHHPQPSHLDRNVGVFSEIAPYFPSNSQTQLKL